MFSRRALLGGGLGTMLGSLAATPTAAQGSADAADDASVAKEVAALRDELRIQRQFTELTAVREAQRAFLRLNGKFPDYMEVGFDVWFGVHDWHVRWQQPMTLGRDALGRYTIALNQTVLVLRPDVAGGFTGIAYDNR
jgi:hypothetical protein